MKDTNILFSPKWSETLTLYIYNPLYNLAPAVVDFPTPPFPEATTMTCLTPGIGFCLGRPRAMCCFCLSCNALSAAPDVSGNKGGENNFLASLILDIQSMQQP